jgi:hypothetical protein
MQQSLRSTSRCRRCASPAANRWTAKASRRVLGKTVVHRAAVLSKTRHSFVYDPDPLLSMEAISIRPPVNARAAVMTSARTLVMR